MLPPKNCLPRNYSCIARLFGSMADPEPKPEDGDAGGADPVKPRGRDALLRPPHSPNLRRRCTSLPTPAERAKLEVLRNRSPSSQKKVRFADSLGLDLTSVRHFERTDEPEVPERILSSFRDARALHRNNFERSGASARSVFMELLFTCPGSLPDFLSRLEEQKVLLESVHADEFSISGIVRVLNMAFEKRVTLRYTLNNWTSYADVLGVYVPLSSDGRTDRFGFKLIAPSPVESGGTLQFAIRYSACGAEFWDNNQGGNYRVRRHRFKISPLREWENGWIHFI